MGKDTKIVHAQMINGNKEDIKNLGMALNELTKQLDMDVEFLVTNDQVQIRDVKYLIDELYALYKREEMIKKLKEKKK